MKKTLLLLFIVTVFINIAAISPLNIYAASEPVLESEYAVLMNARTGQVLYNKGMNEKSYPASITKIMTSLLAVEKGGLDTVFTADKDTVNIERGSSSIYLSEGEKLTIEQLLYGVLLNSGNDAANALAQYVSGSVPRFAELMTQKAKELGAKNTHFANANGLHDVNHYTTAYDMAMITKYAITLPFFKKVFGTVKYDIPPTNKYAQIRYLKNHHKLLSTLKYDPVTGGKTGWTTPAGNTLVTVAEKDGKQLIAVILKGKSSTSAYNDTKALFEYGFKSFKEYVVSKDQLTSSRVDVMKDNKLIGVVDIFADKGFSALIPVDIDAKDIRTEYTVPGEIKDGDKITAIVKFVLPGSKIKNSMGSELGTLQLTEGKVKYNTSGPSGSITPSGNANTPGQTAGNKDDKSVSTDSKKSGLTLFQKVCFTAGGTIIVLVLLAMAVRKYNFSRRKRKSRGGS